MMDGEQTRRCSSPHGPGQDQQVSVIMAVVNHIHPGGRWVLMNVEHSSLGMLLTLLVDVTLLGTVSSTKHSTV